MKCSVCNNEQTSRLANLGKRGPRGIIYEKVYYCAYCEWKGTSGPGAQLRAMIKEINREISSGSLPKRPTI